MQKNKSASQDVWIIKIGGSAGSFQFAASMLALHKAFTEFRNSANQVDDCHTDLQLCTVEAMFTNGESCLECTGSTWQTRNAKINCHNDPPHSDKLPRGAGIFTNFQVNCPHLEIKNGGVCEVCSNTSCSKCNGSNLCSGCLMEPRMVRDGSNNCVPETCGPTEYYQSGKQGRCYAPQTANCQNFDEYGKCVSCDNPKFKLNTGICCQEDHGYFIDWLTSSCKTCDPKCKKCHGPGPNDCEFCYDGTTVNPITRSCTAPKCLEESNCSTCMNTNPAYCTSCLDVDQCIQPDMSCGPCPELNQNNGDGDSILSSASLTFNV